MQNASTSQQPQAGSTTWNTAPTSNVFPQASQPRSASTPKLPDGDRRGDTFQQQQYSGYTSQPQYSPTGLTYYPNQTLQGYRRTSNPKASTPPSSAPPPTNASPTSQYYPRNDYTPQSAPPQMTSQPQTAHPYGNYYPGYYDYAAHTYPRQPSGSATTPTLPHTPTMADRPAEYPSGYSYDPRQYQARPQQYYPQHQYFQWPGYGYPQQQPGHQSTPAAAPPQPPHSAPPPSKKRKKDDIQQPVIIKEEEEVEDKSKSKKKGKKEDVPPKLPAKSHLHPPRQAQSAWQLFFTDELNKAKAAAASGSSPGGTPHSAKLNVAQIAKDAGTAYGLLAGEQKEYYARKVQESKDQYAKELLAWQATLTPEDIRLENAFRAQQRKDGKSRKGNLKDPNAPKKPLSAYFLFLKSIREDDALRARVWGDESETTKQSVMAAEKWRALSDTEKRPYLSKAEKDKQDYEVARKIYEADATARARGEIVPDRPHIEIQQTHVETPQSLKPDSETLLPSLPVKSEAELDFSSLKPEKKDLEFSSPDHPTYDQFAGFNDPLEGIDLPGLDPMVDNQEQWDDLHHLMGENQKAREKSDEDKVDAKEAEAFESMSAFIADPAD